MVNILVWNLSNPILQYSRLDLADKIIGIGDKKDLQIYSLQNISEHFI